MTNSQLIALIARLTACVYAAGVLLGAGFGPGPSPGQAAPAKGLLATPACAARSSCDFEIGPGMVSAEAGRANGAFLARVHAVGRAVRGGIARGRQMGPTNELAGPANDLPKTGLGPQRDLFGTPFGPLFLTNTGAKYANLAEFRQKWAASDLLRSGGPHGWRWIFGRRFCAVLCPITAASDKIRATAFIGSGEIERTRHFVKLGKIYVRKKCLYRVRKLRVGRDNCA